MMPMRQSFFFLSFMFSEKTEALNRAKPIQNGTGFWFAIMADFGNLKPGVTADEKILKDFCCNNGCYKPFGLRNNFYSKKGL